MARQYIVFTYLGDYHIYANSKEDAKRTVFNLLCGKIRYEDMTVEVK